MNILAVVNARSNYACLKTALQAIDIHSSLSLRVVCGGSATLPEYGRVSDILIKDGLPVDHELYSMVYGDLPESMVRSMAMSAIDLSQVFAEENPDAVLIVGDRFETLAAAVTAAYMNIPLIHVQGGERSGSIDEKIRHAITKLADLHFTATKKAGEYLVMMGESRDKVHVAGCPSVDLLTDLPAFNRDLIQLGTGYPIDLDKPYLVVLQHPVTTEEDTDVLILPTLMAVKKFDLQAVWLYPNIDAGSSAMAKLLRQHGSGKIRFFKNFAAEQYASLINDCSCLVGNSSSALRTGAFLGVPAVNIGHRQQHRECAHNIVNTDIMTDHIFDAIQYQANHGKYEQSNLYGDGKAGRRIAQTIAQTKLTHTKVLYGM